MRQSIASDAIKLTTSKLITMVISLATAMLLSRFRTLEEYGTYAQLLLVTNLVTTMLMLGLPNSINYFLARAENDNEKQRFISVYYSISTVLSGLTGFVLVVSTPFIVNYFSNPLIKNFMYVFAIFPWARIILSSIEHVLIVYQKTNYLMAFRILNSLFLLSIIVIVEIFNWSFAVYMALFIITEAIFALSVYFIARKISGKLRFLYNKNLGRQILTFSIPIGLASVVGTLSIQLDKLVIGKFFSTEGVAIYTNAAREMPITIVASSLTAVLMPQLVRLLKENRNEKALDLWGDSIFLSYTIICYFAIGLFVFAPEAISLLYSEKYLPGVEVFRVYSLVLLLRVTYFGMILNSIGKTKLIFYSSVISLALNLILNFIFYRVFGFIGPAIATFISILLVQMFQLIATSISIEVPLKNLFPWKELVIITMVNIMMGLMFALLKRTVPAEIFLGEILESLLLGAMWGLIYIGIMYSAIKKKWIKLNEST